MSEYDVIVLGSGMAGLSAALAASEMGLRTIVIEKASRLGGGSVNSWGVLWAGNNHLARAAGFADCDDDVLDYMHFLAGDEQIEDNLRAFVQWAPKTLSLFEQWGIPFRIIRGLPDHYYGIAPGGRPEGRCVEVELMSGTSLGNAQNLVSVSRMTPAFVTTEETLTWGGPNHLGAWDQSLISARKADDMRGKGYGLISHLVGLLRKRNVTIRTGTVTRALSLDQQKVNGVVLDDGSLIGANAGVVLATGGYESSPELVDRYDRLPNWLSYNPPEATGDGLELASAIGAAQQGIRNNMQLFLGFEIPDDSAGGGPLVHLVGIVELFSPHTMVVNAKGRRFGDESYFQRLIPGLKHFDPLTHGYSNLPCFLIFDQQYASAYGFGGAMAGTAIPNWVARDDTLGGLALKLGIEPEGLAATADRFNGFVQEGRDLDFGRGELAWRLGRSDRAHGVNPSLGQVSSPPFYGIELRPSGGSSVGVLTNAEAQVLHVDGSAIRGLYAAGNTAANVEFGAGYQAGFTLMSGMTFGYLAARHMASLASRR